MLQLFVYGPGLGLPSLDPSCLAAILYCSLAVPKDEFVIYQTANASMSPTQKLPALWDGHAWIGSLKNVLFYLKQKGYDLDNDLDKEAISKITAFSCLLERNAYDLWLFKAYVCEDNYVRVTRPEWSKVLGFPYNYLTPNAFQKHAKERLTLTLGISDDKTSYEASRMPISHRWTNASRQKQALLQAQAFRIRMSSLARQLYGSLELLIGDSEFLFGENPTSLDCLLYAFLSFHTLTENFDQLTLRSTMQSSAPKLFHLLESLKARWFPSSPSNGLLSKVSIEKQPQNLLALARLAWNNVSTKVEEAKASFRNVSISPQKRVSLARNGFFILASTFGFVWFVLANGIVVIESEEDADLDDLREEPFPTPKTEFRSEKTDQALDDEVRGEASSQPEEKENDGLQTPSMSAEDLLFGFEGEDEDGYDDWEEEEMDDEEEQDFDEADAEIA
ncbi:metaxin [Schizosaccharomyces cryophilus OY26]|uniref:Metaxin n=1 Tax=Schizosaccharomyces cryophilus (strain OY26 / ATCC MYA-4695 / CBS 11777 / NBRC 106824 / NRRL Y48691) TaxID=653667 RepID=S9WXG7_SCHCR|nr:metaxin [Schizosaccharomyces cryophilus OY26]EPY49357.1 metaxin [Schizosaccharomyces cryophilus OY26]